MTSGSSKAPYRVILRGSGDDPRAAHEAAMLDDPVPFVVDCPIPGCGHPVSIGAKALCSMSKEEIDNAIIELSQLAAALADT